MRGRLKERRRETRNKIQLYNYVTAYQGYITDLHLSFSERAFSFSSDSSLLPHHGEGLALDLLLVGGAAVRVQLSSLETIRLLLPPSLGSKHEK